MMQADGMIDGLAEPFDHGDFAPGIDRGAKDDFLEQVDRKVLGARKCQENTPWIEVF